jgi:hypothetical protein
VRSSIPGYNTDSYPELNTTHVRLSVFFVSAPPVSSITGLCPPEKKSHSLAQVSIADRQAAGSVKPALPNSPRLRRRSVDLVPGLGVQRRRYLLLSPLQRDVAVG